MKSLVMRLPAITTEMDTGRLLKWMVAVGDQVKAGDPICEFTTDKVDTELESPYTGTIKRLLVPEGGRCAVGEGICVIEGVAPDLIPDLIRGDGDDAPVDRAAGDEAADDPEAKYRDKIFVNDPCLGQFVYDREPAPEQVLAPRAIRLKAQAWGVDLAQVVPTGSRGQVTLADLEAYAKAHGLPKVEVEVAAPAPLIGLGEEHPGGNDRRLRGGERRSRDHEDKPRREGRRGGSRRQRRTQPEPTPEVAVTPPAPVIIHQATPETTGTLYTQVDITDLVDVNQPDSNFALLARLVWAYGQTLWHFRDLHRPLEAAVKTQGAADPVSALGADQVTGDGVVPVDDPGVAATVGVQAPSGSDAPGTVGSADTKGVDQVVIAVGMERPDSTLVSVPLDISESIEADALVPRLHHHYDQVQAGDPLPDDTGTPIGSLIDLGPWQVERCTPTRQPGHLTGVSLGCVQTLPSLLGRTITIRQFVTIGLAVDYAQLDPAQAGAFMYTLVQYLTTSGEELA